MNRIRTLLKENETLREMLLGIFFYGLVIEAILAAFFPLKLYRAVGLACGILCGMAMAVHMAHCLEMVIALDEKKANAYARKKTIQRYLCVCAVVVIIAVTKTGDPVTFVLGTLGLKIGAYLQPLTHRITGKICHNGQQTEEGEEK